MRKEDAPKKRNGYYYRNDKQYVSVTKVLGDVIAKPALIYWNGREACRLALKEPWLNEKEVMAQLQLNMRATQERGKYIHSIAETAPESFIVNFDEPKMEYEGYIKALKSWWETFKPEVIGREVEVYSDKYNYAGRCDLVCNIGGEKILIDFKTSSKGEIYKETGLQLSAYKHALAEEKIVEVDSIGAVALTENGEYIFKKCNDDFETFLLVLKLWEWIKEKGE